MTFDVEIIVTDDQAQLLRSGMSADLEIVTSQHKNVPLIPVTAVKGRGTKRFVILASGERRMIKTGPTDGTKMVVLGGLEGGEEIVVSGRSKKAGGPERGGRKRMMPFGPRRGGKR